MVPFSAKEGGTIWKRAKRPHLTLCPSLPFCARLSPLSRKILWRVGKNGGIIPPHRPRVPFGRGGVRRREEVHLEKRERPIGVFDSGLGGISVLRACVALLPRENFLFFGDSANAPYGEKPLEEVRRLTVAAVDRLLAQGVKAIVVACNTATSAAIGLLRQAHPELPIIGIEPAVKPAAQADNSSSVIVMATPLTIREDKYQRLAASFCDQADVISLPCKGLAEMVEQGIFDGPVLDAYLQELLLPFRYCNVDYIVLGCTHYPFVRQAIARNFGRPVSIIDGSDGTARQLRRQLNAAGLLTTRSGFGTVTFQNSRPDKLAMSQTLFQMKY